MKKLIVVILTFSVTIFAGGLVTNLNQSTQYVRTLNRNASTELDAVFYNPAGLAKLNNGFYAYLSNQSIFQVKGLDADYGLSMNTTNFEGNTGVWFYPNIYLALKQDKFTLSAGLMPIGGGGSAEYKDGLPSFESGIASLVPALEQVGVTDYKYEVSFEGSSVYLGWQAGLTYELNDQFSIYGGVRFIRANNTYEGYLKNIQVNPMGGEFVAPATYFSGLSQQLSGAAATVQPILNDGGGSYTLQQLVDNDIITATEAAQLKGGLVAVGVSGDAVDEMDAQTIYGTYTTYSDEMATQASYLEGVTADKDLDATRSGYGFAAIIGANYSPNEDLNIGFRYESKTTMTLKNNTESNTTGRSDFDDGVEFGADLPALAAMGVSYQLSNSLRLEANVNYFFDPQVDWDGREDNLDNCMEFGLAAEYAFTEDLCASVGYLNSNTSATEDYRTDLDYGLDSNTLGFGIGYKFSDQLKLDFGALNTFYIDGENALGTEEYYKKTFVTSLGLSYKF